MYAFTKKKKKKYIYIYMILKRIVKKNSFSKDETKKILKKKKEGSREGRGYVRVCTRKENEEKSGLDQMILLKRWNAFSLLLT